MPMEPAFYSKQSCVRDCAVKGTKCNNKSFKALSSTTDDAFEIFSEANVY